MTTAILVFWTITFLSDFRGSWAAGPGPSFGTSWFEIIVSRGSDPNLKTNIKGEGRKNGLELIDQKTE